jgi:hypothetical protein
LVDSSIFSINSANAQKDDALESFARINEAKIMAETAVSDGDDTLKKANNTYQLLQSFQSEVTKSSEGAKIALEDVPFITEQIIDTEGIIRKAEEVRISTIIRHFNRNFASAGFR